MINRLLVLLLTAILAVPSVNARPVWHARRWEPVDGVPAAISSLAQTKDGFIWIGSITGLYRFDGIKFEQMPDPRAAYLSQSVIALLADESGGLWIGHESGGISYYKAGEQRAIKAAAFDDVIHQLLKAPDGSLWGVGASNSRFFLVHYANGKWQQVLEGERALQPEDAAIGADGTLWLESNGKIRYLAPGGHRIQSTDIAATRETRLARDREGRVWANARGKLWQLLPAAASSPARGRLVATIDKGSSLTALLFDGHGDLWRLSAADGLARYDGRTFQHLASNERKMPIAPAQATGTPPSLVDHEGNVWIATEGGLDEFTRSTFSVPQGFDRPVPQQWAGRLVMRDGAGRVWLRYGSRLYRVGDDGNPRPMPGTMPSYFTPCPAVDQGIWRFDGRSAMERVGGNGGVRRMSLGAYAAKPGTTYGCAADGGGGLWINNMPSGMARLDEHGITVTRLPSDEGRYAYSFATKAGQAMFYMGGGSLWQSDGMGAVKLWAAANMPLGFVRWMTPVPGGILLGGPRGIGLYDGRTFHTLLSDRFAWLSFTAGGVQTVRGEIWLQTPQGVIRMVRGELDRAMADPHYQPRIRLFDMSEGLPGAAAFFNVSGITADPQGRIWVATDHGIAVADPADMPPGNLPVPVSITSIHTEGASWLPGRRLVFPSGTSRIDVDYTGLSFINPGKIRFRYRLLGIDKGWVDAGNRRHVTYTNLAPGTYVLKIAADNGDGLWLSQEANLEITIQPSFLQSPAAYVLGVLSLLLLFWLIYLVRMRTVSAAMRTRFEIRLRERERIARDLHDSLLQSVQGVFLRFQSFVNRLPREDPARGKLEGTLDRAQLLIDEARDHVFELREPEEAYSVEQIVEQALVAVGDLAAPRLQLRIEAHLPNLPVDVAREVQAILCEALFNAERHAQAKGIAIEVRRARYAIVFRVSDDGVGIPSEVLAMGKRERHFGLISMRERAAQIDSSFSIINKINSGAEITVSVPIGGDGPMLKLRYLCRKLIDRMSDR